MCRVHRDGSRSSGRADRDSCSCEKLAYFSGRGKVADQVKLYVSVLVSDRVPCTIGERAEVDDDRSEPAFEIACDQSLPLSLGLRDLRVEVVCLAHELRLCRF